jgi:2'-5' RNA ligase
MSRSPATARLFVAIDPPADVREQLAGWAKLAVRALGLRWGASSPVRLLEPELLHLTLCFLGDRQIAEITAIEEALAACARPVGALEVGAPVWLPPRRPRALAVEVRDVGAGGDDPANSLATLHDGLLAALARACGFVEEPKRRLRAHITLARMHNERGRRHGVEHALLLAPA